LREAADVIFVVSAFLSAYNARFFGVKDYIAQMMFNSPPGTSDAMDVAKMLAVLKIIKPLAGPGFRIWKQTRTGLLSYPLEDNAARAHLATSIYLQMAIKPHIIHVVGHTEADHAATAEDVIQACRLAHRAVENALGGAPDMTADPVIHEQSYYLVSEAQHTLEAIREISPASATEPYVDAAVLANAVSMGVLDAPQLKNNLFARGQELTRIINGSSRSVDQNGRPLSETARLKEILHQ
jgi:hypothetical protein